ncbi:MAG TPA: SMC family ATPase [Acidimicrobiales bacterium]|nr:SMC family ATPase [Acidimicrobiales bacterium]
MRPARLELEGFTAFRESTVVDFEGADLFALTGATGSGKTSVLDAMVFALYGNVPRLADQRAVAPVIAQGMAEARIRLDFTIGDESFTATRIVRRTKGGGATTSEARLEANGEVLAGTADEVSDAVTRLLGLTYDHFTKCVVLPQGEFARFLHDKPAARQDLLISLLDLGVYDQMADLAGKRAAAARAEANVLDARLDDLAGATPDAIAAATRRVTALVELVGDLDASTPELAALDAEAERAEDDATKVADDARLLATVKAPHDLAALHRRQVEAVAELASAIDGVTGADATLSTAEATLASLGDRTVLARWLDGYERLAGLRERRVKAKVVVVERRADLQAAQTALDAAQAALDAAVEAEDVISAAHRAHRVRADLVVGEPCPVCLHEVEALPKGKAAPAITASRKARDKAERDRRAAGEAHSAASQALAVANEKLVDLGADIGGASSALDGAPVLDDVQAKLDAETRASAEVDGFRAAVASARAAHAKALAQRECVEADERDSRAYFDRVRDGLAALQPPAREGGSVALLDEWNALAEWASVQAAAKAEAARELHERVVTIASERAARLALLAERCALVDLVVPAGVDPAAAARETLGRTRAELDALEQRAGDAERLRHELTTVESSAALARGLALHLDARHFEKWLLDEAMSELALGATELLRTLSGEQYSLRVDSKSGNFVVVDHRNADEVRAARTLSGGETFLTSLALALALADRIATLAARGSARLESIFLDEGFGTLDPETLDVVASAIEELGAGGRLVGVVSHIAELAERLPVRYEVRRTGNASTVVRIDR